MRTTRLLTLSLALATAAGGGFLGGTAWSSIQKKPSFQADAGELDRTELFLRGQLTTAIGTMKQVASDTTAENAEPTKKEREQAIAGALRPLQEDVLVLMMQAHLLGVDSIADKTGEPAEQFLQQTLYDRIPVAADEVAARREKTGLGHGGLLMGYVVARIAKVPADDVFAQKMGKSWPEVLRLRGVSPQQLVQFLEGKQ